MSVQAFQQCSGTMQPAELRDGEWVCPSCGVAIEEQSGPTHRMTKAEYELYLQSPEWQQIRNQVVYAAGHRCRGCDVGEQLEVHHRTYERVGDEYPEDLTVLCHDCHMAVHTVADARRGVVR